MSLVGGLAMYMGATNKRYKSSTSPYGRKVRFLNENGYDMGLKNARRYFKKGQILTVNEIAVDDFSSTVEFVEYPEKWFNTVMFADVKETNKKKNKKAIPEQKQEVFIYEQLPFVYNTLIKDSNAELISTQSNHRDGRIYTVIYRGLTAIVILDDGSKGIARCNPKDKYSKQTGYDIAFYRAQIKSIEKELDKLCGRRFRN